MRHVVYQVNRPLEKFQIWDLVDRGVFEGLTRENFKLFHKLPFLQSANRLGGCSVARLLRVAVHCRRA